ncbi:MAG: hypothetical protein WC816_08090 [Sphingomonas sp.]
MIEDNHLGLDHTTPAPPGEATNSDAPARAATVSGWHRLPGASRS